MPPIKPTKSLAARREGAQREREEEDAQGRIERLERELFRRAWTPQPRPEGLAPRMMTPDVGPVPALRRATANAYALNPEKTNVDVNVRPYEPGGEFAGDYVTGTKLIPFTGQHQRINVYSNDPVVQQRQGNVYSANAEQGGVLMHELSHASENTDSTGKLYWDRPYATDRLPVAGLRLPPSPNLVTEQQFWRDTNDVAERNPYVREGLEAWRQVAPQYRQGRIFTTDPNSYRDMSEAKALIAQSGLPALPDWYRERYWPGLGQARPDLQQWARQSDERRNGWGE